MKNAFIIAVLVLVSIGVSRSQTKVKFEFYSQFDSSRAPGSISIFNENGDTLFNHSILDTNGYSINKSNSLITFNFESKGYLSINDTAIIPENAETLVIKRTIPVILIDVWEIDPIFFTPYSATIDNKYNIVLESLSSILQNNPILSVNIKGYHVVQELGKKLDLKRAQEVQKHLINLGVNPDQISITNSGPYIGRAHQKVNQCFVEFEFQKK